MLEFEEALARVLASVPQLGSERVPLRRALDRIAAETVVAPLDLPLFDNSAMDGYAVRSADVRMASPQNGVVLHLSGKVAAGEFPESELHAGTAIRVFTGSVLPSGADAVVMQEDTSVEGRHFGDVVVRDSVKAGENVRFRAEDVKSGTHVLEPGERITLGHIALLSALGISRVAAGQRPRVALLASGSELRAPGRRLRPGEIYESNSLALAALVSRAGAEPKIMPLVRDSLACTHEAFAAALNSCDAVVSCGGASVGEFDFVKQVIARLGGELDFWRVAIKPGRPFLLGRKDSKPIFGLPGNPVSALVTFVLLVRPALLHMQGWRGTGHGGFAGVLGERLRNDGGRRHFVRVLFDQEGKLRSAGFQASHRLGSLPAAVGLVDLPPGAQYEPGRSVHVIPF